MAHYVLTTHPTVRLRGPFDAEESAAAWGRRWQTENSDCPRWHTIELDLADGRMMVPVELPDDREIYSVIYSAPWHDDCSGYHWSGTATSPADAVLRAVASELPYGNIDRPEETSNDAAKVTIIWCCRGTLPAYVGD